MHKPFFAVVLGLLFIATSAQATDVKQIQIENNQPFALQMPLRLYGAKLPDSPFVQNDGDESLVLIKVDGKSSAKVEQPGGGRTAAITPADGGVSIEFADKPVGKL